MKTNLSSQIKLDTIPRRYYAPEGDIERASLTREEKIYTRIFESASEGSVYLAKHVADLINRNVRDKGHCVLALGAGFSTHSVYSSLIDLYREGCVSFKNVIVFNLCEFYPEVGEGSSTFARLKQVFLDHVDLKPSNIHTFDTSVTKEQL